MITYQEWQAALRERQAIMMRGGVQLKADHPEWQRYRELRAAMQEFQEKAPKWSCVCTKSYYAGQGTSWEPGDVHSSAYDERESRELCERLNTGWGGPDAWIVKRVQ